MTERIYVVTGSVGKVNDTPRLVRASHPANALRHVAAATFTVGVATQDELVKLLGAGTKVESITAEQTQLPTT